MKPIGFAIRHAPNHVRAFYGRLIEFLSQELGPDFEVVSKDQYPDSLAQLDGKYRIVLFAGRKSAAKFSETARVSKSFLVDHGIIHTNRTPSSCPVDFEVFSSPFLLHHYSRVGLEPKVRGWSARYFLSNDTPKMQFRRDDCMVYLTHKRGWQANSEMTAPFGPESNLRFIRSLSEIYSKVYVVGHINMGGSVVGGNHGGMPGNVIELGHGRDFMDRVNNVGALFFEYSSVFATALWNPDVMLFQRVPPFPTGAVRPQAVLLHILMEKACYRIEGDDLSQVKAITATDGKAAMRKKVCGMIYAGNPSDSYMDIRNILLEALGLVGGR